MPENKVMVASCEGIEGEGEKGEGIEMYILVVTLEYPKTKLS